MKTKIAKVKQITVGSINNHYALLEELHCFVNSAINSWASLSKTNTFDKRQNVFDILSTLETYQRLAISVMYMGL